MGEFKKMKAIIIISFLFVSFISINTYSQSFSTATEIPAGPTPYAAAAGYFNGDGLQDLAILNNGPATVSIRLNLTTPGASVTSFSSATDFAVGSDPRVVAVEDINGDGKQDLIVTNLGSSSVSILLNTTVPGSSTPSFSPKTDFPVVNGTLGLSLGDLNGDGKPDLAATNHNSGNISIYINTTAAGASTPTLSARTDLPVGANPYSVTVKDFNGDGMQDIAAANFTSSNVSVFLNLTTPGSTTPAFSSRADFTMGSGTISVAAGDLNGDGKPDLAAVSYFGNFVSVMFNTTSPGASAPSFSGRTDFPILSFSFFVSIEDINEDGRPDMIVTSTGNSAVSTLFNITAPGASTPAFNTREDFATGNTPQSVSAADLNGDGKKELVTGNVGGSVSIFMNQMILGNTPASFSAKTDFTAGANTSGITSDDFNGDGKIDMAVSNASSNSISVFLNTIVIGEPTPAFSPADNFASGNNPLSIISGDLNGDGKKDIVTANLNDNTVSVFFNTTAAGAASSSFSARTDFSVNPGPYTVSMGDINNDGKPDLITPNISSNSFSVLMNTTAPGASTPTFSTRTDFACGGGPAWAAIKDLNGDGSLDVCIVNHNTANVSIFFNTTTPGASTPTFTSNTDFATGPEAFSAAVDDLNGDGKPDLAVENFSSNTVSVLINTTVPGASTPSFSAKTDFAVGFSLVHTLIKDVNGDGKKDLIIPQFGSSLISVILNTTAPGASAPTFSGLIHFTADGGTRLLTSADFNGDGKPDIGSANYSTNNVSVLLNSINLPLPVELTSFTSSVDKQNVILNWSTVIEENNMGFEVERNSFGTGWKKIGFVNGAGNTSETKNYSFADNGVNTGNYHYRLKQIDYNGNYKYYELQNEVTIGVPGKFMLSQNYPNPFNPSTIINYQLAVNSFVTIKIFDINGREVKQLVNETQSAGYYSVNFSGAGLSSGSYFYKISAGDFSAVKKMLLVK